jgi:hypothetical protein
MEDGGVASAFYPIFRFIASAVVAVMTDLKVFLPTVATGLTALIIKRGIANFCNAHKPIRFMELRRQRANKTE